MANEHSQGPGPGGDEGAGPKYFFFIDGKKYDWPKATLTGAELRAVAPDLNPAFLLILEGHGGEADKPVGDSDSFSLSLPGHGPLKFYTAPPATFGSRAQTSRDQ